MEAIANAEGEKGIMISGDEVGYVIIQGNKTIDLYMKPKGRWSFKFVGDVVGDSDSTFHVGPPEEMDEKER